MKKIFSILAVVLFAGSMLLSSCSTNRLCPAYPPSVYSGDTEQVNDQIIDFENIEEKL
mgnify:CR=1 FL=1